MHETAAAQPRRLDSLRYRIESLTSLRRLVSLPPDRDVSARQWARIEGQLGSSQSRLLARLDRAERDRPLRASDTGAARRLQAAAGEIELQLSRAFTLFDTYMDVLTQRHSPELGPMLRGCDALAWNALRRDHPALSLVEAPIVFCDRGFGAAILRRGVLLPDDSPNPLPLVQIPYSRLREKHNLTSIAHECGHEAIVRLRLREPLAAATREAVARAGGSPLLAELYALWMGEIGPDFWTFGSAGLAQPAGAREILALPPADVFRIIPMDPHPPPWLRVLLSCAWCRRQWGRGPWDAWEREWDELYPLAAAPAEERAILRDARALADPVSRVLFAARFRALGGRRLVELFELEPLAPERLARRAAELARDPRSAGGAPCPDLAAFRLLREGAVRADEQQLDRWMTRWLEGLGERPPVVSAEGASHA